MNTSSCGFYFCFPFVNVKNRIKKNNPFQCSRIPPKHQTHSSAAEAPEGSSELCCKSCLTALTPLGQCQLLALPSQLYHLLPLNTEAGHHTSPSQAAGSTSLQAPWLTFCPAFLEKGVHPLALPEQRCMSLPALLSLIRLLFTQYLVGLAAEESKQTHLPLKE